MKGYPIKLVRDRIPEVVNPTGEPGDLWYAPVTRSERAPWLRKKLLEEVAEYLAEPGIDELADVLAVVAALAEDPHGSSLRYLTDRMNANPRGGFSEDIVMYGRHKGRGPDEPR